MSNPGSWMWADANSFTLTCPASTVRIAQEEMEAWLAKLQAISDHREPLETCTDHCQASRS